MTRMRIALLVSAALVLAIAAPAAARTAKPTVVFTDRVSGPTPLAECFWPQTLQGDAAAVDEPDLAVDPRDARHLVSVWLQGGKANAYGIVAGISKDGGRTWTRVVVPITDCDASTHSLATDATVSFGPDGVVYVTAMREAPDGPPVEGVITRSLDGGLTWSSPVVFDGGPGRLPEGPRVTADPRVPGRVYVAWYENPLIAGPGSSIQMRQIDWAAAGVVQLGPTVVVQTSPPNAPIAFPTLRVLPDRTLLIAYLETQAAGADVEHSTRSADGGLTWSTPATIAVVSPRFANNPDGQNEQLGLDDLPAGAAQGDDIGSYPSPSLDVAPNGDAYAAFQDITSPDGQSYQSTIWVARATAASGWSEWTTTAAKSEPTQAFMPTLAVGRDGTVGVTYYDLRDDAPGPDDGIVTDFWFTQSQDRGATWQEVSVAGPYTNAGGTGEYFGLTALPGGFGAAYTYTPAGEPEHQLWFARVRSSDGSSD